MLTELTEEQFQSTFAVPMTDVTETAEPILDIWPFVEELVNANKIPSNIYDNGVVRYVYRNPSNTYDHLLLPTDIENVFLVIIIDLLNVKTFGYYNLDLNKLYGID
ncbi:hypothetical protein [Mucilaginibacter boryungensis]|uniref:Phage protein n=1 Tax=Mucilaginibacter boryungensis TaxID=768480 RepID=A0ABR9XHC8_9SPHI|nr:hypothetical protein [Mucilaginibacter boryungensis]MBE9666792.1 hypothetical protein [Mucilaginibacter boryungensis]